MLDLLIKNPPVFVIAAITLLIAITIHEASHAFVSDKLGDPTAKLMGRLSLNPFAHLDPLGTLFLFIIGFGWGKPVPVDPFNLRNPRRDSALISLAGPASNLITAVLFSFLLKILILLPIPILILDTIYVIFAFLTTWSVVLAIFNLLPISPLDGFKIVGGILPKNLANQWDELENYGIFFLILMLFPFGNGSLIINLIDPIKSFILNLLLPGMGTIV